jgi:hypothetical protein
MVCAFVDVKGSAQQRLRAANGQRLELPTVEALISELVDQNRPVIT